MNLDPNTEDIEIMNVFTKLYIEDIRPKVLARLESTKQAAVDVQGIEQGTGGEQNNFVQVAPAQGVTGAEPNDNSSGSK